MKNKTLLALFLLAWVTGWPGLLTAQEESPSQLLERAADLAREERFDEAIGIWLGVLDRLDEGDLATTEKKLGIAFQQTGRLPEAWHYLSLYLASPSGKGDETMAGWLHEVETGLKATHIKVTFSCHPDRLTLAIPASKSGAASSSAFRIPHSPFVWWFLPGKHSVEAFASGHKPRTVKIDVRKTGDTGVREIRLVAIGPDKIPWEEKPGPDVRGTSLIVKPAEPREGSRALEWTLIGSGLALGVTGGIFHGLGYSKNEDLDSDYSDASKHPYGPDAKKAYDAAYDDEVRPKQVTAYVLYGVGGAALVAGIVTWAVRKPGGESDGAAPLTVAPLTLPGGGGAMMTLEW
jgi:hypothetical protein